MTGRARGRAKAQLKPNSAGRNPGPESGPVPGPSTQQAAQSHQGVGGGESLSFARATSKPSKAALVQETVKRVDAISLSNVGNSSGNGNGNGDNGKPTGRGGIRGRREIGTYDELVLTRPTALTNKKGSSGAPIQLHANYFALESFTDWVLYQYKVDFKADEKRTFVRKAWLRQHKEVLGNNGYLFDGTVLYTSRRLTSNNEPLNLVSRKKEDNAAVPIELKLVGQLKYGDSSYIQVFNILVRRCLHLLDLQLIGRNFFDSKAKVNLRDYNLELWPGYVTSIRQHESKLLMCAEVTTKVMRTDTVLSLMVQSTRERRDGWQQVFQQAVLGKVVLTDYNNKTYTIDDVDFNSSPMSTFDMKGRKVTFVDYYKEKYQINIRDARQPLLVSKSSARDLRAGLSEYCLLIPELCRLTGLSDADRANFHLMRSMADITRIGPHVRAQKLIAFNNRMHSVPAILSQLDEWQLKLSKDLVQVPGRVLNEENIVVGKNHMFKTGSEADWSKDLRNCQMLYNKQCTTLSVVVSSRLRRDAEYFLQTLNRACQGMGFQLPPAKYVQIQEERVVTLVEAADEAMSRDKPDLIMFFVQNNNADKYNAIKKKCCIDRGVPSQVICARNTQSKGVMSIATKVGIQLNSKLGGAPWSVDMPIKGVMVVGFDVCHDTAARGRSFGAMVASLDKAMSRYYSTVSPHTNGEELSNSLSLNIAMAVRKYKEVNGSVPSRIMVYRDGVGVGQIDYVYHHEVQLVKDKLTAMYESDGSGIPLKFGYIIVSKRINTRFFNRGSNPPPGTIVDDVVTLPSYYDFFLVSQSVRQGTVAPTSYNVISDTLGFTPEQMQRWTYKMTHLYYNWSGTVRVPAPCQYAHKLAFLVGQSLHKPHHPNLETKLFFL